MQIAHNKDMPPRRAVDSLIHRLFLWLSGKYSAASHGNLGLALYQASRSPACRQKLSSSL
ncbi:hypothetical protein BN131_694 [Cronobacter malonaticus 681]|nr:hypothetical protein BN131_694 [Cronobacter malonaticus 681]